MGGTCFQNQNPEKQACFGVAAFSPAAERRRCDGLHIPGIFKWKAVVLQVRI